MPIGPLKRYFLKRYFQKTLSKDPFKNLMRGKIEFENSYPMAINSFKIASPMVFVSTDLLFAVVRSAVNI